MIDYSDDFSLFCLGRGSVVPKACLFALPSAALALVMLILGDSIDGFFKETGIEAIKHSFMWTSMTVVIATLLTFRTRQALGRFWEGSSLLHQMKGEWFDAASCLVTFTRDAAVFKDKVKEVVEFRGTLLRLMSLMHATALDEISSQDFNSYQVLDIEGLDVNTLKFLKSCRQNGFNRVEALQHMIQVLVTHNYHNGVLTIPPPILSRVFQTLSRGLVNLLNAKKIKDTKFPLPYAQIIKLLLVLQTFFTPLIITMNVDNKVCAMIMSFCPLFGMWALNLVAAELEMPFGLDANDLPLDHFQDDMNQCLVMLAHSMADHLPHTSKFASLLENIGGNRRPRHSKAYMEDHFLVPLASESIDMPPVPHKDIHVPLARSLTFGSVANKPSLVSSTSSNLLSNLSCPILGVRKSDLVHLGNDLGPISEPAQLASYSREGSHSEVMPLRFQEPHSGFKVSSPAQDTTLVTEIDSPRQGAQPKIMGRELHNGHGASNLCFQEDEQNEALSI